jgi:hypothetical protein
MRSVIITKVTGITACEEYQTVKLGKNCACIEKKARKDRNLLRERYILLKLKTRYESKCESDAL